MAKSLKSNGEALELSTETNTVGIRLWFCNLLPKSTPGTTKSLLNRLQLLT